MWNVCSVTCWGVSPGCDASRPDGGGGTEGEEAACRPSLSTLWRFSVFVLFCCGFYLLAFSSQVAEELMEKLGVAQESLVTGAYMDLLLKGTKET